MKTTSLKKLIFIICMLIVSGQASFAQEFINTSSAKKPITIGFRFGINTSNQAINLDQLFNNTKKGITEWGTGFEMGAVVNLNIKDYLTLQPGFMFQNKSYNSTLIIANYDNNVLGNKLGHSRFYYFQIPVMASFRFNLTNDIRWHLDFGPYFAFGLGGNTKVENFYTGTNNAGTPIVKYQDYKYDFFGDSNGSDIRMATFDWGFKIGTALSFKKHYSIGIHYNAGCKNIANNSPELYKDPSAKNKSWTFSLGYDF